MSWDGPDEPAAVVLLSVRVCDEGEEFVAVLLFVDVAGDANFSALSVAATFSASSSSFMDTSIVCVKSFIKEISPILEGHMSLQK